ncbi:hypothetical protein ACIBM4_24770 [Streptomyces sp. NPDC050256]|uniref:hypothetical protein n=1 Tax=unclassified Streptomyces TaxID=2593676 RepID=UPI0037A53188
MAILRSLAESALQRIVPRATAEAATVTYKCMVYTGCPGYPGNNIWKNVKYIDGQVDTSYKSCCYKSV